MKEKKMKEKKMTEEQKELIKCIKKHLDKLNYIDSHIIMEHFVGKTSLKEIAKDLDMSYKTILRRFTETKILLNKNVRLELSDKINIDEILYKQFDEKLFFD